MRKIYKNKKIIILITSLLYMLNFTNVNVSAMNTTTSTSETNNNETNNTPKQTTNEENTEQENNPITTAEIQGLSDTVKNCAEKIREFLTFITKWIDQNKKNETIPQIEENINPENNNE